MNTERRFILIALVGLGVMAGWIGLIGANESLVPEGDDELVPIVVPAVQPLQVDDSAHLEVNAADEVNRINRGDVGSEMNAATAGRIQQDD